MLVFKYFRCMWLLIHILVQCYGSLQQGYSKLQRGHRLDRKLIQSFTELSFLDCVVECLVTPRCKSVNYFKGANFCEINYKNKTTAETNYVNSAGWVYSEKEHWPKELAGACLNSNCSMNEKCSHKKYSKDTFFECILSDCGFPNKTGINLSGTAREDAIGMRRRMHASCPEGYIQSGSGLLICTPDGHWKYNIHCEEWLQHRDHIYYFSSNLIETWDNAQKQCKVRNAYLVEINSREENAWLHDTFLKLNDESDKCNSKGGYTAWTGGRNETKKVYFIWSESGEKLNYTNWNPPNPDNYRNQEHCIQMLDCGRWNDNNCNKKLAFICEKNLNV